MKRLLPLVFVAMTACIAKKTEYTKAENALDAGREFIDACANGDFGKAAFYMVNDDKNKAMLGATERAYREKDKEGRQQARMASIHIAEVRQVSDSATLLYYSSSADKQPRVLEILKQNGNWLVNFANTYDAAR